MKCAYLISMLLLGFSILGLAQNNTRDWQKEFVNPSNEFRPQPFWHMNGEMSEERLLQQLQNAYLKDGFGGVTVLPVSQGNSWGAKPFVSPGTTPAFLSTDFFDRYRYILNYSKQNGKQVVMYDDLDFPSGIAGGQFEKVYPEFTRKYLTKTEKEFTGPLKLINTPIEWEEKYQGTVAMNTRTMERIDLSGKVKGHNLTWNMPVGTWRIMTFYLKGHLDNVVDFMSEEAIRKFMSMTYDQYDKNFKPYFGTTITKTFFDDIGYYGNTTMWSSEIAGKFEQKFGEKAVIYYPALWYNIGSGTQAARASLFSIRAELMATYPKMVSQWCAERGISAMGHPCGNYEPNTNDMYGDPFKFYRYQQIPLLDIIHGYPYGRPGFKLISSAADVYNRPIVGAEIYGNYTSEETDSLMIYRMAMEAMARGVNFLIPHGMWLSPDKMRIRPLIMHDNPALASAFPNYNTWAGRCISLLQGGARVADIALYFPIESLEGWSDFSRKNDLGPGKDVPAGTDYNLIGDLLTNQVRHDFTFLHHDNLTSNQYTVKKGTLTLNCKSTGQQYHLIILPSMQVISVSALQKIYDFYLSGGKIIATGEIPCKSAEFGKDDEVIRLIKKMMGVDPSIRQPTDNFVVRNINGGCIDYIRKVNTNNLRVSIDSLISGPDVRIESVKPLEKPDSKILLGVDKYRDLPPEELGVFSYIHKQKEVREIYLFANSTNTPVNTIVRLKGKLTLEKWDPHTGAITPWPSTWSSDAMGKIFTTITLELNPVKSTFAISK